MFKNKTLLITGGTGSFGHAVLKRLIDSELSEIRIFSRDEKKQDDMRKLYSNSKLRFYIGDVRDYNSILNAMRGVNYVFHAAALKQVPSCEFYPLEATKTNVLGTENVLESSINCDVSKVICLSTDKAVYPINAMGISKSLMEKVAVSKSRMETNTTICVTRYGNVMGSRGSVIPHFVDQITNDKNPTVTDPKMTRFMMTLESAVELVLFAFNKGSSGDIFVQKAPAVTIDILARSLIGLMNKPNLNYDVIGTRHGEKLYEVLLSREEMSSAMDLGAYYKVPPDLRGLNYEIYTDEGNQRISAMEDYNSHNTLQLDEDSMKKLLLEIPFIRSIVDGQFIKPTV